MTLTLEQKIARKTDELNRLKRQKEKQKTRQKIIVGGALIKSAYDNPAMAQRLIDTLHDEVTRTSDLKAITPLLDDLQAFIDEQMQDYQ